jgi:hypothetical protein
MDNRQSLQTHRYQSGTTERSGERLDRMEEFSMILRNQFKRDKSSDRKSELLSEQKGDRLMTPADCQSRIEPALAKPLDFFNQRVMLERNLNKPLQIR